MKSMFSLLVVLAGISASAQTTTLAPATPGFGNVFGSFVTGTNVPPSLSTGLAALQNDIQQLLPVLADFNDTTALSALLATLRASATGGASVPPPLSGQLLSTRTSSDFATLSSQNFSTSLATSVATPTAGGTFSPAISPIQPVVVPSATGGVNSPVMTNAFGATVTILDVARDLVVLQNDLERLLPVLVTLNGSGVPAGFTNTVGSSVGNSPAPTSPAPTSPAPTFSPVLTPTGR